MSSKPISILITGANRGLGLEMVKQMIETQRPLSVLFACCRDPDGPRAEEFISLLRAAAKDSGTPGMSLRKAAVINISTLLSSNEVAKGTYSRFPDLPYRVSKAALNMMSVCASVELQKDEILCMLLHPGWVRTDMGGPEGELGADESVEGMLK
ncbi:hypothetical protein WMY93_002505 [Mugilogobius chulae]|uniref:C-factor n=1 Tax=Mugilogobius chulae TaxID=88201 RepID=A0AAW0Q4X5_9GOBI